MRCEGDAVRCGTDVVRCEGDARSDLQGHRMCVCARHAVSVRTLENFVTLGCVHNYYNAMLAS